MLYTKAISPVSNSYLTKGKEYEILELDDSVDTYGYFFTIIDDEGDAITATQHISNHINGLSWQLK